MLLIYPAIFHEEDNAVWVEFPDLEGCQTYGDTIEECIIYAQEALEGYAESVVDRGMKLPAASDIKKIETNNPHALIIPIYCDFKKYEKKSVKKTLTIPQWLNEKAMQSNINFSETLQNALIEKLYKQNHV